MDWNIEDKILILETGKKFTFDFPIKSINDSTAQLDITLEVPNNLHNRDNRFYFSKKDGKISWRGISHVPKLSVCPKVKYRSSGRLVRDWGKEDNKLLLGKNTRISFDCPIKAVLNSYRILVILLDVPPKQSMTENVFGVSEDGKIIWQIERIPEISTNPANYYTGVNESGTLGVIACYNWCGMNVFVDIETGKIFETQFAK